MIHIKKNGLLHNLRKRKVPLAAFVELTNRCNLRCIHCMRSKTITRNLPKSICKGLINQLAELGTFNIIFSGGEPILHENFIDLVVCARENNFNIKVSSNGTTIDKKIVCLFKDLRPITVQISLYGAGPSTHDAITQTKGSYKKTVRAINLLKGAGIPVLVHMMVMKENFRDLESVIYKAKAEKQNFSYDFILYPHDNGSLGPLSHRITDGQLKLACRKGLINPKNFIETGLERSGGIKIPDLATISCRVSPSGQVFPSGTVRLEIGNLKQRTFRDIWFKSQAARKLRNLKASDFECSGCPFFTHCSWDIGLAFAEHGNFASRPTEWCRFVKQLTPLSTPPPSLDSAV